MSFCVLASLNTSLSCALISIDTNDTKQMKVLAIKYMSIRYLKIWHDHSSIAGHSYLLKQYKSLKFIYWLGPAQNASYCI